MSFMKLEMIFITNLDHIIKQSGPYIMGHIIWIIYTCVCLNFVFNFYSFPLDIIKAMVKLVQGGS